MVDGHHLRAIERPRGYKVNLVKPTVLRGVRFHTTDTPVSE